MAEQGKGGIFAKAQKQLTRTKTKVLQNLGKAGKTTDEAFDEHIQKLDRQQENAARFQKEFCKYLHCAREMVAASKSFVHCMTETYEPEWQNEQKFKETLESWELMWNDYVQKLQDQIDEPLKTYRSHFQPLKGKVSKRGRKLVYYDNAKHHLEVLQNAKKKDDAKIAKAEEEMNDAKKIYETLNKELHVELPEFHNSRINFYATTFNNLFNAECVFHTEVGRLTSSLGDITESLAKDSEQLTYTPRRPLSINNSLDDSLSKNNYTESPVKSEPESPIIPTTPNGHPDSDEDLPRSSQIKGIYENEMVQSEHRRSNDIDMKGDSDTSSNEKTPKVSTDKASPHPDEPNIEPYYSNDLNISTEKTEEVKKEEVEVGITLSSSDVVKADDKEKESKKDAVSEPSISAAVIDKMAELGQDIKIEDEAVVKGDNVKEEIKADDVTLDKNAEAKVSISSDSEVKVDTSDIKVDTSDIKVDTSDSEVKTQVSLTNEVNAEISSKDAVKVEISSDKQNETIEKSDDKENSKPVPRRSIVDTENEAPDYPAPQPPPDSLFSSDTDAPEQKLSSQVSNELNESLDSKDEDRTSDKTSDDSDNSYDCPPTPKKIESNNNTEDVDSDEAPVYEVPPAPKPLKDPPTGFLYKVQATHAYAGVDTDELSFESGDVIYIIEWNNPEEQDDGWQMGIKETDGTRGVFPENFTRRL